jgi:hypothetical protein
MPSQVQSEGDEAGGEEPGGDAANKPMLALQLRFHSEMAAKLEQVLPAMSLFDTESLLVGLGLMEVRGHFSSALAWYFMLMSSSPLLPLCR